MTSWLPEHQPRATSPMYDDRGRDYRDSRDGRSRDFDEEERRRQWDEYERAREEWERRVSEYKNGEVNQTPAERGLKRPRSPSPHARYSKPRRDNGDQYGRARKDGRRSPRRRHSPQRKQANIQDPMNQDKLPMFRAFVDWYREVYPEKYKEEEAASQQNPDPNVGMKARYEEFRLAYNAKQVRVLFQRHHKSAWFLEKYDPTEKYTDVRARVRKQGWQGALDGFISELEAGKFDSIFETSKQPYSNPHIELQTDATASQIDTTEEKAIADDEIKAEDDNEWMNSKPAQDGDEIIIPHKGHQVMIKTIPPDIGRLVLEPIVNELSGVVSLALGEPVARRQYHRSAWIEFGTEKEARIAMSKLAGHEIGTFRLQVAMIQSPLVARIKRTSVLVSKDERMTEDLQSIKRLVAVLEEETNMLENYKALSLRLTEQAGKDREVQVNEVSANEDQEYIRRGSIAVEKRIERILLTKEAEGLSASIRLAFTLDMYLTYLRSAFYSCYYCAVIADRADELQRKCVKHVRTPWSEREYTELNRNSKRVEREEHWFLLHDEKLEVLMDRQGFDPVRFGGKNYDEEVAVLVKDHYRQEGEGKYKCIDCKKMFKSPSFVTKHISNKHPEHLTDEALYELRLYNNFALDPHKIQMPSATPAPPGVARHARDAGRRGAGSTNVGGRKSTTESVDARKRTPPPDAKADPRAGQKIVAYQDLDEVVGEDVALTLLY